MEVETEDDLSCDREWGDQEKVLKSKQIEEIILTPVCGSPEVEQVDADGKKKEDEADEETMSSDEDDDQSLSVELQHGKRILNELMSDSNKSANWPFMNAVDENDVPDYYERISNPMWLRKIKKKFCKREYNTITEYVGDFRLMLENCFRYNGPDHYISKRGQRLETMMEQKLTLLSRTLREKTSITATSGGRSEDQPTCTSLRRRNRSLLPHDSSGLLNQLRHEELLRERELRKQQALDRKAAQEAYLQELQDWEDRLLEEPLHEQLKAMWEIPQIGHFLFLCQDVLNLDEVIHYELERCFLLARESSTMQRVMTSLLSTPYQRRNLDKKPFMPYKIWEEKLRVRVRQWYKALDDAGQDSDKAAAKLGIDSMFFRVSGKRNPLEKRKYHELSFYRKVWIMKTVCDHCLETQDTVREAIEAQVIEEQRSYELGVDKEGTTYLHFPQFCGADLRLYRQDKAPMPVIQREIQTMVDQKKHVKRSSTYKFPAPIPKKKKKKKVFRPPAPAVITPTRPSHLRQHLKAVVPLGCAVQSDDSDDSPSDEADDDDGSKGATGSGYFTHTKSNLDIRQPIGLPTLVARNDGDATNRKSNSDSSGKPSLKNSSRISCKKGNNGISKNILNALDSNKDSPQSANTMDVENDESSVVSCEPQENDDDDASTDCYIGDDCSSTNGSLFTSNNNKSKGTSSELMTIALNIGSSKCPDDLPSENDVTNKHEPLYSEYSNDAKISDCSKCVNIDHNAAIQSSIAQCEHLHNPLTDGASVAKPSNADDRMTMSLNSSDVEKTISMTDPSVVPCIQDVSQATCNGKLTSDCAEGGHLQLDDVDMENDFDVNIADNVAKHQLKLETYSPLDRNDAGNCMPADSSVHDITDTDHMKHELLIENSEISDVTTPESKSEYIKNKLTVVKCEPNAMGYEDDSNSRDIVCVKSYVDERTACGTDNKLLVNKNPRINNESIIGDSLEQLDAEKKCDNVSSRSEKHKPTTFSDNDKTPVASDKAEVLPAEDCKTKLEQSDEKLCDDDGKKAQIVVKTEPVEENNLSGNEKTAEGADELRNDDKESIKEEEEEELTPEIGPFELLVENVDGLRQLIDDMQSKESTEVSSRRQKMPPKKRSINLCINLQYLLKELEPWETKLIQANKRAKLKLRREQETYVEEPEVASPDPNVWDSEESVSESSDNEATSESVDKSSQPKVISSKKSVAVVEETCIIPAPDDDSNSSISSRGRLRKRRFIPNNVEDQLNRKRKSIKKEEPEPTTIPNHVPNILQRHSTKVAPSNKTDGSSENILQLSLEQLKSLTSQGVLQVATSKGNILLQSTSQPSSLPGNILGTSPKKLSTYGFSINRKQLKQDATAGSTGNNVPAQHFISTRQLSHPVMQQLLATAQSSGLTSSLTLANVAALHASTQATSASILSPRGQAASSLISPDNKAKPTWSYLAIKSEKDDSVASITPGASSVTTATIHQNAIPAIRAQAAKPMVLSSPEKTTSKVQYFNTINTLPSNVMQQLLRHPGVKLQTTRLTTATQNIAQRPNVPLQPRILGSVKVQQPAVKLEPGVIRAPSGPQQNQQLRLQASGLLGLRQAAVQNTGMQVHTPAPFSVGPSRLIVPVTTISPIGIRQINPTTIKVPATTSLCLSTIRPGSSIMQPVSVSTTMQLTSPIMSTSSGQSCLTLSPHRPRYACNLTVKYLLENRTSKSEGDTSEQSVVLGNGAGVTSTSIAGITSGMDSVLQIAVTSVSSSLATVNVNVPAPITMPSINPKKNTTCTIQSMKAPIAVTPKLEFKSSVSSAVTNVPSLSTGQTSVKSAAAQNTITVVQKAADGKNVLLKVAPQNIMTTQGLLHGYLTPQVCIFPQSKGLTNGQQNVSQAQIVGSTATVTSPSMTVAQQPMLTATMAKVCTSGNGRLGVQPSNLKVNPGVLQNVLPQNVQVSIQQQTLLQNPSVSLNSAQLYNLMQKAISSNQLQLTGVQPHGTTLNISQQQLKNMLALSQQNLQGSQLIPNSGPPVMKSVSQILPNQAGASRNLSQTYLKTSSAAILPQSAKVATGNVATGNVATGNVASELVRQMTASHLQAGVDRFTLKSPQNETVASVNPINLQQQVTSPASATMKVVPMTTGLSVHSESISNVGLPLPKATKPVSSSITGQQQIIFQNSNPSSTMYQQLGTHLLSSSAPSGILQKTTASTVHNLGGTTSSLATTVAHQVIPPNMPRMTSPVQLSNNPAQKLILYNVGGQLVTAQGVPVTLDNGVLKIMPQGISTISRVITPQIPSTSGSIAAGQLACTQSNAIKPPQQSALNIVKQEPNQVVSPAQVSLRVQPSPVNCLNIAIPQSTGQDGGTMLPVFNLQNVSASRTLSAGVVMPPAVASNNSILQSNPNASSIHAKAQLKPFVAVLSTATTPLQTPSHLKPPVTVLSPTANSLQTSSHPKNTVSVLAPTATPLQIQSHLPQPNTMLASLASPLTASPVVSGVLQHSIPQQNSGNLGMLVGQPSLGIRAMISPGNIIQTPLQFGIISAGNNSNVVGGLQMLISPGKSPQNVLLSPMNPTGSSGAGSAVIGSNAAIGQNFLLQTGINRTVQNPIKSINSYPALATPIVNSAVQTVALTACIPGQPVVRPQRQGSASCIVTNSTKIPVASPSYSARPVSNSISSNPAGLLHASSRSQQVLPVPPHMTASDSNTVKPDNSTISHNVLSNSASVTGSQLPSRPDEVNKLKVNVSGNSKPDGKRSAVEESAAKILSSIAEVRVNELIQSNNRLLQSVNKPTS